jgi:hypothetical protein
MQAEDGTRVHERIPTTKLPTTGLYNRPPSFRPSVDAFRLTGNQGGG